jgi:hypothetical protein
MSRYVDIDGGLLHVRMRGMLGRVVMVLRCVCTGGTGAALRAV